MPKLIIDDTQPEEMIPHHAIWRPNPPKALFGSLVVSISLFYLFIYLASIGVQYSSAAMDGGVGYVFPITNLVIFGLWFIASAWLLKKLGWQTPWVAIMAMVVTVILASYSITSVGQTLVSYPIGAFLGICVLLFYYFLYQPRIVIWVVVPFLFLIILGYLINQRVNENYTMQNRAATSIETNFIYPIYFPLVIPTKQMVIKHLFWDASRQNLRFVTQDATAINETYEADRMKYPPALCGTSSCVDLGEIKKGQHLYTDKNNPYFVEYYVMFDNTLVRLTSNKSNPLTKAQAEAYLREFTKVSPTQLMGTFDHDYYLSESYYFIPKQTYNVQNADYSVMGEITF